MREEKGREREKKGQERIRSLLFLLLKDPTLLWCARAPWQFTVGGEDVAEHGPELGVGGEAINHVLNAA